MGHDHSSPGIEGQDQRSNAVGVTPSEGSSSSSVCQMSIQLFQLWTISRSLTLETTHALVQAFVSCHLYYCNSLLASVADVDLCFLQLVQIAATHLFSGDHITPVLATLCWLPVCQRVIFKTAVLVWKCLHDIAPCYLVGLQCMMAMSTLWNFVVPEELPPCILGSVSYTHLTLPTNREV